MLFFLSESQLFSMDLCGRLCDYRKIDSVCVEISTKMKMKVIAYYNRRLIARDFHVQNLININSNCV